MHPGQYSSEDNPLDYEHSRSSSVGDIHWGTNGADHRLATPDGYDSLPYDSTLPCRKVALNGAVKRSVRSGAVRVDLSFADKSIRRPGSAPDLVNNNEFVSTSLLEYSLSDNKNMVGMKNRGLSTSSDRDSVTKRSAVSPATRKVAFAGITDDSETETEKSLQDSVNSMVEEVWVRQQDAYNQALKKYGQGAHHESHCNGMR